MAVTYQTTSASISDNATSVVYTTPASATTGRLIVLTFFQNASGTFTLPAGFTSVLDTTLAARHLCIAWKIAVAGDASAARTISSTATGQWAGWAHVYDGADATSPIPLVSTPNSGTMSTTAIIANGVTISVANSVLAAFFYLPAWGGVTFTGPTGMTQRISSAGADSMLFADEARAATGATGTRTATAGSSVSAWGAVSFQISPAAAAGAASLIWPTETPYRILSRR